MKKGWLARPQSVGHTLCRSFFMFPATRGVHMRMLPLAGLLPNRVSSARESRTQTGVRPEAYPGA